MSIKNTAGINLGFNRDDFRRTPYFNIFSRHPRSLQAGSVVVTIAAIIVDSMKIMKKKTKRIFSHQGQGHSSHNHDDVTPALELTPDTDIAFKLSHEEATPKFILSLKNTGTTEKHVAFKVKTTQPRRYLVRPNQGVIAPNSKQDITLLLIEKDKEALLQTFERLGQSGLDNSKDKFLVQSCVVDSDFATKAMEQKSNGADGEAYEALTTMWNSLTSSSSSAPVYNKTLYVRHIAQGPTAAVPAIPCAIDLLPSFVPAASHETNVESMTNDQLKAKLVHVCRKYDELVSYSTKLTAERDVMNDMLERMRRDYSRELFIRSELGEAVGIINLDDSASLTSATSISKTVGSLALASDSSIPFLGAAAAATARFEAGQKVRLSKSSGSKFAGRIGTVVGHRGSDGKCVVRLTAPKAALENSFASDLSQFTASTTKCVSVRADSLTLFHSPFRMGDVVQLREGASHSHFGAKDDDVGEVLGFDDDEMMAEVLMFGSSGVFRIPADSLELCEEASDDEVGDRSNGNEQVEASLVGSQWYRFGW